MKKRKISRKERRERLGQIQLAGELQKVISHFFPRLLEELRLIPDPRHQSYITYSNHVLLMSRILSAILYIGSMRKSSEELNCDTAIENLGYICGVELEEAPYWETINNYLKQVDPETLQNTVTELVRRLIRSKAFDGYRVRDRHWQIILDGTQLHSAKRKLDGGLFRVHNRGTEKEYTEYYRYVLEAKLILRPNVVVSIMSEFVENTDDWKGKQDCERNAAKRLMERLKAAFPRLPICISADSLYACEPFFRQCEDYKWKYLLTFREGSIPSVAAEYYALKDETGNRREIIEDGIRYRYDFVPQIEYEGHILTVMERSVWGSEEPSLFLTNLPVNCKNLTGTIARGRWRWKIENEGFNTQKKHGYSLEHIYSYDGKAAKNHYFLIQIGHMIAQIMEAWSCLWEGVGLSREQKHRRILESWKTDRLRILRPERAPPFQIRFD